MRSRHGKALVGIAHMAVGDMAATTFTNEVVRTQQQIEIRKPDLLRVIADRLLALFALRRTAMIPHVI